MLKRARSISCPEDVDEKLSDLAHALANLVQAVSGNLELLAEHTADETSRGLIANAREATRQLTGLTRGLQSDLPSHLKRRV